MLIRRDIWTLSTPQDPWGKVPLAYAKAVRAMQALPATDPRSWAYQANIHGTYTTPVPFGAPWNSCQHSTWYFLPWHRMYLYQLEQIVKSFLSPSDGKANWALPYWNYSNGAPGNALPPCFRVQTLPDGSPNPLFVAERRPSINNGSPLPAQVTDTGPALAETQFVGGANGTAPGGFGGPVTGFAHFGPMPGELESLPHNVVHVSVGGNGGLMTDPNTAAQDPIFYLHHSNIDRLWNAWLAKAGNTNPAQSTWQNKTFKFRDATGASVSMKTHDVLDSQSQLNYKYQ